MQVAPKFASLTSLVAVACAAGAASLGFSLPATAQPAPAPAGSALPTVTQPTGGEVTQVFVSGGNRALFKVAVVPPVGDAGVGHTVTDTATPAVTLKYH